MTLTKKYFRTFEKIKKKTAANQEIQEELEKKLDMIKDVTKWESILALTFDVSIDFYMKYYILLMSISNILKHYYFFYSMLD